MLLRASDSNRILCLASNFTDDFIKEHEGLLSLADRFMIVCELDIRTERGLFYWNAWKSDFEQYAPGYISDLFHEPSIRLNVYTFKEIQNIWRFQREWHLLCAVYLSSNCEWVRNHILRNKLDTYGFFEQIDARCLCMHEGFIYSMRENFIPLEFPSFFYGIETDKDYISNADYRGWLYNDGLRQKYEESIIFVDK